MQQMISQIQVNSCAIYCRLSREDGDSFESSSIQSQKELLSDYALSHGWNIYDYYIDDGYSGTNFDRPGFKRMIKDCEQKRINIIITKDLSRLGRNYLDTGKYTEEYFPMNNIRYIAINDNFDTAKEDNDFAPFKNIINEWYAKDISKKVKSTFEMKVRKGEIPSACVPIYGYIFKDEKFNRKIDPETAPIVKMIFDKYLEGYTIEQLAKLCTSKQIYVPGYYFYKKFGWYKEKYSTYTKEEATTWKRSHIQHILEKYIEYNGNYLLKKTKKISFKLKKRIHNKIEDCQKIENACEAIITTEMANEVRRKRQSNSYSQVPLEENLYKEFLICKSCGTTLRYKNYTENGKKVPRYMCRCNTCTNHSHIRASLIDKVVLNEVSNLYNKIVTNEDKFLQFCSNYYDNMKSSKKNKDLENIKKEIASRNERLAELEKLITKLFESRISEDIPQVIYENMMKKYKKEAEEISITLDELSRNLSTMQNKTESHFLDDAQAFIERLKGINLNNLTRVELLNIFESITISKTGKNEYAIHFKTKLIPSMIEEYINEQNNTESSSVC